MDAPSSSGAPEKSQAQGHGRREEQEGLRPQPSVTRMHPSEFRELAQQITGQRSGWLTSMAQTQDHQMDEVVQGQSLLPPSAPISPRSLEHAVKPSSPVDTTANHRFSDGYNKRDPQPQQFRSQVEQTRQTKKTCQKLRTEAPVCAMAGAMFRLPAKLDGLLASHGHMLPRGAEEEVPLIKQDLEEMVALLQEHDDSGSMTAKCLAKEVCELSYDMEDSVDQYAHAANSRRGMLSPRRKKYKVTRRESRTTTWLSEKLKWRLWMANKIREFSVRSQEALQRYNMFSLGGIGSITSPRRDVSFGSCFPPLHGELVGIDDHVNTLEAWLGKDGEHKLKVVSVVGSGGIGKTTLSKELYLRIRGQFECRAFVRTSRKPDIRRLLISLLSQVRPHQTPHTWKLHSLIADIRTHLRDKRYLIVIDDVWDTQTWDIINCALPAGNLCSGILITTEVDDLALKCCGYDSSYVLTMKPLGHDDSSKLFFNTTLGPQYECPPELSEAAHSIVRKCAGLPLAMVIVASLLVNQMGKPERWDYVNECLGYDLRTNPSLEGMKQVLNLSYNNLPQQLKACMMYLSIYEEDYIILKDDLVKQWIAEGFIHATEEQDMEEISRICFGELISRRLIQPVHINDNGDVLSCTVHRMILDFIKHKSFEENFVTAIDNCQITAPLADKVRRLSLHFGNAEATPPTNMRLSQVRTLAFFGVIKCLPSIVDFGLLQVLILHLWGDDENICVDLTGISELFRLRYLHATCNATLELPQTQMRGLQYLETMKIDARVSAVPSDIVHLPGLLHLSLPVETNLPNGIDRMTSLCTLGYFDLSVNSIDNVQSLIELANLRDLRLTCSTVHSSYLQSKMDIMGSILAKLSSLRSVTLEPSGILDSGPSSMSISCDGLSSVSSPPALLQRFEWLPCICTFSSIPMWIGHLNKLCILKVGVRELASNDVDVLRRLPALTVLSLYVRAKPAGRIVFTKTGFSVLKCFKFRCSVPWLEFEVDAMPNLLKLKLGFDAYGKYEPRIIPVGIMHLIGLKEISAKIGGAGAIDPGAAESALIDAIEMHPARPTFNIQSLDRMFSVKDDNNSGVQEEEHTTLQTQYDITEEDSMEEQEEEHMTLQKQYDIMEESSMEEQKEEHMTLQKKYNITEEDSMEQYGVFQKGTWEDAHSRLSSFSDWKTVADKQPDSRTPLPDRTGERTGERIGLASNTPAAAAAGGSVVIRAMSRARGFFGWLLSHAMTRKRSGPSSLNFKGNTREYTFAQLASATNGFVPEAKIGAGSFGTVYRGKLPDGREVTIKRGEASGPMARKFLEKESAFWLELAFLSGLHHKHLVSLVGYCEENDERLLVYEYMKNGALYDHLHPKGVGTDADAASPVVSSWKLRIKILLDASRGIEYLHSYAVPPIIHRDIKSSNILLDGGWLARVSDLGLSLMGLLETEEAGTQAQQQHLSMKAAGTVGYMDPEHYSLHHLTVKSDVYGFGVVMLETLTGKRAIFKEAEGGSPVSVVDYAQPNIVAGELGKVLDWRVPEPSPHEAEAVELVAYTAVHCVRLEGKDRPAMADIVANLETAFALCEGSAGGGFRNSSSSGSLSP